jgi:hypothetical protein
MRKCYSIFALMLVVMLSVGGKLDSGKPSITSPNNIYLYDSLLLVSDSVNGLLIYSVANDKAPRFKARIPLRGNRGMAMKDSIIYANSWGGILAMRLVNDTDYEVTSVIKSDPYHSDMMFHDDYYPYSSSGGFGCFSNNKVVSGSGDETYNGGGAGGSYAIFAVIDSFLYYIDNQSIITMDISEPALPHKISETYVDWSIETLFPTRDYLFIGGSNGMYVLDRSDPAYPKRIGSVTHFRAKDPVVVRDSMAYVTLRTGNDFSVRTDELMVVNLKEIASPKLVREIPLSTPYGLSVRDTLLYVAQGNNGWTLFNLSNPLQPAKLKQWSTPSMKDFIWTKDRFYAMCFDGVRIYSVADPFNPALLAEVE